MAFRIWDLAKELGVPSERIIGRCRTEGIPESVVPNSMAVVTAGLAATIREWFVPRVAPSTLILTAAPKELFSLASAWPGIEAASVDWMPTKADNAITLARTGVGKVNAVLALTQLLPAGGKSFANVINMGVCGSLPRADKGGDSFAVEIGDIIVGTSSIYADEGIATPTGFRDLASIGFPIGGDAFEGSAIAPDAELLARLTDAFGDSGPARPNCHRFDLLGYRCSRAQIVTRTGAIVEAMEGAAIGHAAARLSRGRLKFIEVRVVSNTTGDRNKQLWDLSKALSRLTHAASIIKGCLTPPPQPPA